MAKPVCIARQAAFPRGVLGWIVAQIMSRETRWENRKSVDRLELCRDDDVLEIGCGHGANLTDIADRAPDGLVVGVDPSKTMTSIARRRGRGGNIKIYEAGVEAMPFRDHSFDCALSVHTIYFWPDAVAALSEIRRVVRPGGRLVICCRTTLDPKFADAAPEPVYKNRSVDEVREILELSGWRGVSEHRASHRGLLFHWFTGKRPG